MKGLARREVESRQDSVSDDRLAIAVPPGSRRETRSRCCDVWGAVAGHGMLDSTSQTSS